jgi:hypothetical protein
MNDLVEKIITFYQEWSFAFFTLFFQTFWFVFPNDPCIVLCFSLHCIFLCNTIFPVMQFFLGRSSIYWPFSGFTIE